MRISPESYAHKSREVCAYLLENVRINFQRHGHISSAGKLKCKIRAGAVHDLVHPNTYQFA